MYSYTAVVPSKDIENIKFSVTYLAEHSCNCKEIIVIWDGLLKDGKYIQDILDLLTTRYSHIKFNMIWNKCENDVYGMFNRGAFCATQDYVMLFNDDMYFPKNWDYALSVLDNPPYKPSESVITFQLVEPGFVDVNEKNIHKDFGRTLKSFDKVGFDEYSETDQSIEVGLGWFMPVIFPKTLFIRTGGYPIKPPFPHPNDVIYFSSLNKLSEIIWLKCDSRIYHFQRLSQRDLRLVENNLLAKLNLCCGRDRRENYLNVDVVNSDYDFTITDGTLPFKDSMYEEILMHHCLEHFRYPVILRLLKEIQRILRPNGFVDIRVPDLKMAIEDLQLGYNQYNGCAPAMQRIYGLSSSEEQVHKWGFNIEHLTSILKELGFGELVDLNKNAPDELAIRVYRGLHL
jgi:predicted SAM-dependent methyltransferase